MVNISPSIYIGLGGSGILAISRTKKMYEDAFGKGNIPEQIAFVAIDFDLSIIYSPDLATDIRDDFVKPEHLENIRQIFEEGVALGKFQWMFDGNVKYIDDRLNQPVMPVRQIGRLLTEINIGCISRKIDDCVNQVKRIIPIKPYDIYNRYGIDFHIAMSLAGGTGGGAFLNIAHLIRTRYSPHSYIIGYGILHSIFRSMDFSEPPNVVANVYSAILDLDYLMSCKPINLSLNSDSNTVTAPIYDEFYIIDHETENVDVIDQKQRLCDLLGTCLYMKGVTFSNRNITGMGTVLWLIKSLNFHKLSWVQSLGVCQVVYKGDLLAEIYGLKAANEIIRKLIGSKADIEKDVVLWTEEAGIREDGDNNRLIDGIYAPEKIGKVKEPVLDIRDSMTEIKSSVQRYLNTFTDYPTEKEIEDKTFNIINRLRDKLNVLLNAENGVGNSSGFLNALELQLNQFKNEMNSEKSVFEKKCADAVAAMENHNFKGYEDYIKKWFVSANKKEENLVELITRPAQRILKDRLESERRKSAYEVFTKILAAVAELKQKTEEIDKKLRKLEGEYQNELNTKQSSSQSSLIFEIDLSRQERLTMDFNRDDVLISDFVASLGKSLQDVDLHKELDQNICDFVSTLNETQKYRNKLIVDVINGLNEKEYLNLKEDIARKSSSLLRLDNRGQLTIDRRNFATNLMVEYYYIVFYSERGGNSPKTRFEYDKTFFKDNNVGKEFLPSDFDSMKQKIIFYRSDAAIIPYCISAFDELTVEKEYTSLITDALQENSTSFNPHFDKPMFLEMKASDFKLKPEMQNEAMFYWVCGSLFGWQTVKENKYIMRKDSNGNPERLEKTEEVEHTKYIRIKEGKYYFWNEDGESKEIDGKWVSINNTRQRGQAFTFFKTEILPQIKNALQNKISSDIRIRGLAFYDAFIDSVISAGKFDYIDTLVCSDKNSLTYYAQGKGEDKQFDDEWKFIERHLKNTLRSSWLK